MKRWMGVIGMVVGIAGCSKPEAVGISSGGTKMADDRALMEVIGQVSGPGEAGVKRAGMDVWQLEDLSLPSGKIVSCDAWIWTHEPFTRVVKGGKYPLYLGIARRDDGDERVAFAMLRFGTGKVATWELAVVKGQDPTKLKAGEVYGYGVDSGTGCFAAAEAVDELEKASDEEMKFFGKVTAESKKVYKHTREWVHLETPKGSVGQFSTGMGDGSYASYFGLDEKGEAVALVTDFGVVEWKQQAK